MKLRTDMLKFATPEEALKEALATVHRFKPEPLFSMTGVGSLSPATPEEREQEIVRSVARIERLKQRARGQSSPPPDS